MKRSDKSEREKKRKRQKLLQELGGQQIPFLSPTDPGFQQLWESSYSGLALRRAGSLPPDLHGRAQAALCTLRRRGCLLRDLVRIRGRDVFTAVSRALLGLPGHTYLYLSTRLFAIPWHSDEDEGGGGEQCCDLELRAACRALWELNRFFCEDVNRREAGERGESAGEREKGAGEQEKGAGEQEKGPGELEKGPGELEKGPGESAKGAGELAKGAGESVKGAGQLEKGTGEQELGDREWEKGAREREKGGRECEKGAGEIEEDSTFGNDGTRQQEVDTGQWEEGGVEGDESSGEIEASPERNEGSWERGEGSGECEESAGEWVEGSRECQEGSGEREEGGSGEGEEGSGEREEGGSGEGEEGSGDWPSSQPSPQPQSSKTSPAVSQFNITLLNYMDTTTMSRLKEEPYYGMGKMAVSWHHDENLVPFSPVAVYSYSCQDDKGRGSEEVEKASWRVGLKVAWDINTPGLALPLQSGDCYYMRDDLNRTHQHCVLAGDMARFSSTHRVAECSTGTLEYIRRRCQEALSNLDTKPDTGSKSLRSHLPSALQLCEEIHNEVEFEWLRQYWFQGRRYARFCSWWTRPMEQLEEAWREMESMTELALAVVEDDSSEEQRRREVAEALLPVFTERQQNRQTWKERCESRLAQTLPPEEAPVNRPYWCDGDPSMPLPFDLTDIISRVESLLWKL